MPLSKLADLLLPDLPLALHVRFVADEEYVRVRSAEAVQVVEPLRERVERRHVCDVVHEDSARGVAEVRLCDRAEALLSAGVPYLKLYAVTVDGARESREIGAAGNGRVLVKRVLDKALDNGRFANTGCTGNHNLV